MQLFIQELKSILQQKLPAKKAHLQMAPEIRIESLKTENGNFENARKAAVLIPIYLKDGEYFTALIKRTEYDGVHSGQMAFAGGRWEKQDSTLIVTALREAKEEIGIEPATVEVLGSLSQLYIPPSNFLILPVIGFLTKKPSFHLQIEEVQSVHEIPLKEFLYPKNISSVEINSGYNPRFKAPCYKISGNIIWGATAMVISELTTIIRQLKIYQKSPHNEKR